MIRMIIWMFLGLFILLPDSLAIAGNNLTILSYHDVQDVGSTGSDVLTISTDTLVGHFAWLREHGYSVVSLDDVLAAKKGQKPLPDHAILLTFDDGYQSAYTRVYPLLRLFNYPALIAPVGRWMETAPGTLVKYGDRKVPRERFLTWSQVKEMVDSGLVEVASHTYDLHQGLNANPQGNDQPAATTRRYDPDGGSYESDDDYLKRLRGDLSKSIALIERRTGRFPRAIIWPYGSFSQLTIEVARDLGMAITMGLGDGPNDIQHLSALRRVLVGDAEELSDFVWTLRNPGLPEHIRLAHVDLDYVFDKNPERQEQNLSLLLDRIRKLGINTVYLQAFADPDGDGNVNALYFPNRHLPMRADLFNRVAWQLETLAEVHVYAWMPVLAFEFPEDHPLAKRYLEKEASTTNSHGPEGYHRLSPFHPDVRKVIGAIYEDLAKHAHFSGLLFHDDAYLSDFEDASPWALDLYNTQWNLPDSIGKIRSSPELIDNWSQRKTQFLIDWTKQLENRVRKYRPEIKTARNLYASVVLNPEAEHWFSQSLQAFLDHYDYTAVMAMPYLEEAKDPDQWLEMLTEHISSIPGALDKTVFELQSIDWNTRKPIGSDTIARHMKLLKEKGALNFGYYPEDFIRSYPSISEIRPGISLVSNPFQ